MTYKIIRHYFDAARAPSRRVIKSGLTLEEAQAWCQNPETSSQTAKSTSAKSRTKRCGPWFDGYTQDK